MSWPSRRSDSQQLARDAVSILQYEDWRVQSSFCLAQQEFLCYLRCSLFEQKPGVCTHLPQPHAASRADYGQVFSLQFCCQL